MNISLNKALNQADFWKTYIAVFLSFVGSRLMLQTDIVMIAPLGQYATAAFAVPSSLMIIDIVIAMAICPAISIAVSKARPLAQKQKVIRSAIGFTAIVSLCLAGIGLCVYPLIADYLLADIHVRAWSRIGLFWMTVSIPTRMIVAVATMCLFASNKGRSVLYVACVALIANALLNALLIYVFKLGFSGVYISTCIVSVIEMLGLLGILWQYVGNVPVALFEWKWLRNLLKQIGSEWLRLISWQLESFVILVMLALRAEWLLIFSAFGVIREFSVLLIMPLIALMRTGAIKMAALDLNNDPSLGWHAIKPILKITIAIAIVIGIALISLSDFLGISVYHLSGERLYWWSWFLIIYALSLPILTYRFLINSCYQACGQFNRIASMEIAMTWVALIPCLWLALQFRSPFMFFGVFIAREVMIAVWLRYSFRKSGFVH